MRLPTRNEVGAALLAIVVASLVANMWQFLRYFGTRPQTPDAALGLIYPLNNHGAHAYVSAAESTGLALLLGTSIAGGVLYMAIMPRRFTIHPSGPPYWRRHVSMSYGEDLRHPSRRLKAIMALVAAGYLIAVWLFGGRIAAFVVAHGIVLNF